METFDYSNVNARSRGWFARTAATVSAGVRSVQDHVVPYAHWWEQANRDAIASGQPVWVVLGDSMAQGIGASSPRLGWAGRVHATAPTLRDTALLNLSFDGARIRDVIDIQWPAAVDVLRSRELAGIGVVIGSNDVFSLRWRRYAGEGAQALIDLLPAEAVVATQPGEARAALAINEAIDAAADDGRIRRAEFRVPQMRSWAGRVAADHFHPNDHGYAGMAEVFARHL